MALIGMFLDLKWYIILTLTVVAQISATQYSDQDCSPHYFRYNPKHTACIKKDTTPNGGVNWKSMTDFDRRLIVESHNYFRGNVHVYNGGRRASNMLPIKSTI
ncbi:hypothetical protein EB796_021366 [Bugula neritina]|uniref:Uncharacterized protein n=1 Tax=Bugula neritina TaxID=10212 RepID=A0A7J7J2B9_BUGNE|nr:hypothetical protein EB796_021366 [Bugula neritina]